VACESGHDLAKRHLADDGHVDVVGADSKMADPSRQMCLIQLVFVSTFPHDPAASTRVRVKIEREEKIFLKFSLALLSRLATVNGLPPNELAVSIFH